VGIGEGTLGTVTTNSGNTAVGHRASAGTTGANNTSVGHNALQTNSGGSGNTAIGQEALHSNVTHISCTAVGSEAGYKSVADENTHIGKRAGFNVTSGRRNTSVGAYADNTLTTGEDNTALGYGAGHSANNVNNEFTLGDSSVSNLRCNDTSVGGLSDQRDKANIQDLPVSAGLALINALRPVTFNWDRREWYDDNTPDGSKIELDYDNAKANSGLKQGFLAQEVATAISGIKVLEDEKLISDINPDKLEFSPAKLITNLIKAVQELSAKNDTLETANTALADRITALENA
jgi:hypothetical protein